MFVLFHNGTILSPQAPAEALLVREGRIEAIGTLAQLRQQAGNAAQWVDLRGGALIPAFTDAHIHVWKVGDLLTFMLDLRGVQSMEAMQDALADFARRNPQNPWILARGFNEALFPDGRMPSRTDLDKVVPDRPVQVIRTCAHIAVLNTKALEICGIRTDTPVPEGGEIRRDTQGRISGVLSETALGLAKRHLPVYSEAAYRDMILAAQSAFLEKGIACATDPAVHPELLQAYINLDREGLLQMRFHAIPIRVPDGDSTPLPLPEPYESAHLRVDTVKFFADGGLSGQTAAVARPYRNSQSLGVLRLEADFFLRCALEAQDAGWRIATHAIGGRAIELVLQTYEALDRHNPLGLRHRIEHLGLPEADHLRRMNALGTYCVSQPIFLYELGQNFRQYLDLEELANTYPYRNVLEAGVSLAFSSDAPVVRDFSPLMGLRNAVERRDRTGAAIAPEQAITAEAALRAYTLGAAEANGDAADRGSLEVGKRADLVWLSENLLSVAPERISELKVHNIFRNWDFGFRKHDT